jgi:hypothetical protein
LAKKVRGLKRIQESLIRVSNRKDFILLKSVVFDIIGAERTRARKAWQGSEGRLRTREIGSG